MEMDETPGPVKKFWEWMTSGKLALLKMVWICLILASIVFMRLDLFMVFAVIGYLVYDMIMKVYDPEYEGGKVFDLIEGEDRER